MELSLKITVKIAMQFAISRKTTESTLSQSSAPRGEILAAFISLKVRQVTGFGLLAVKRLVGDDTPFCWHF